MLVYYFLQQKKGKLIIYLPLANEIKAQHEQPERR